MAKLIKETIVPLDSLIPTEYQLHKNVSEEEFDNMVKSLREGTQIEPLTVVQKGEKYLILSGNTRYYAMKAADVQAARVRIVEPESPEEEILIIWHSNVRVKINPMDEADFFKQVLPNFGWDIEKMARQLKIPPSRIKSRLSLTDYPEDVKDSIRRDEITLDAAKWLSQITDPISRGIYLRCAIRDGMTGEVAKRCYSDWKSKEAMQIKRAPEEIETSVKEIETYLATPCEVCGKQIKIGEQEVFWGHKECLALIRQVIEAERMRELAGKVAEIEKKEEVKEEKKVEAQKEVEQKVES